MTGEWNSPWAVRAEEPKPGPASIDIEKAIRLTAIFAKMEASLEKSVESVFEGIALRIEYEELASDPVETIELIFGYLGLVAPETIALRYRKATSDRLSDDICNYAEFEAAVEAAGYSHFLEP
ncbi:hypothetical protein SAMN04490248_14111 [Salinihabitans flavidus]|uniref:Sulfotransferase domain-containing protein n=2 Tax=Salinihabitans flavidus TaxID=569882 RepID=A0A1H8W2Z9_9RHOB|nr:hypothetical protein SAMN04490248_14111 [Salinihabitans flavidus]